LSVITFFRDSFRPAYGKLDVLVSIFPEIPHLATTATATLKSQKTICDQLQLKDPTVISVNPDRSNIFLQSKERPATGEDKLHPILEPLCRELLENKLNMPLTLVYGTLNVCAEGFLFFANILGKKQYFPLGAPPKSENRLFSQYHAGYPQHEKDRLINGLINNTCKARVLFVTVAFGIGVDLPSIRQVIHIGVPRTMEEYFQEVGRAGRDGLPAVATVYYNRYDIRSGDNAVDAVMKELVSGKGCKRRLILNYFGHNLAQVNTNIIHTCCDNDATKCECDECQVQSTSMEQTFLSGDCAEDTGTDLLSIGSEQKNGIRKALEEHMKMLYFGPSCVGGMSLATGFTPDLVDKTVEQCEQLVSIEAVEHILPVFSRENAKVIFDIVKKFSS
jgi:hypothetical protein